mgnify:CR=1
EKEINFYCDGFYIAELTDPVIRQTFCPTSKQTSSLINHICL